MTLKEALLQGQRLLEEAGVGEPRLTAEVLLAYATQHDRVWLIAHAHDELIELWWIHYGRYLHQRIQGKPTQYITGRQEFYGREFRVTPDVLIPRPETEHLVEGASALLRSWLTGEDPAVLDIGTGSGCIAVTLALETKARMTATDLSSAALRVARENAAKLGAEVTFVEGDLAAGLPDASFDLVVSNPPYVPHTDKATLQHEVRDHEPELALYGGEDGYEIYRRLIPEAHRLLKPGGWLMMEMGWNQGEALSAMLASWTDVRIQNDLAGLPRLVIARKRTE
jgi:release factor glutamine methyltransferase